MEETGDISLEKPEEINESLFLLAQTRFDKARTKEGKRHIFFDYEKEYASSQSIPQKNIKLQPYRLLLWELFQKELMLDEITIDEHGLKKDYFNLRKAKENNQDNALVLSKIIFDEKNIIDQLKICINKRLPILHRCDELTKQIIRIYGP